MRQVRHTGKEEAEAEEANAFAVRSIDNHIYRAHVRTERRRGRDDKMNKKKTVGKTKENIEFSKDLFWLAVVAARLPVVTQLDPKFRLYLPYHGIPLTPASLLFYDTATGAWQTLNAK